MNNIKRTRIFDQRTRLLVVGTANYVVVGPVSKYGSLKASTTYGIEVRLGGNTTDYSY